MRVQQICSINREFGVGVFIKKESILSSYNFAVYLKVLWFKLGFRISYGYKSKQWANRSKR